MNEFIEQFVLESRELVQQATHDLLALEKTSTDKQRLDSAFRAFHTLKGGAGIVDFAAMEKAVHAAEDALAAARSGARPITAQTISDCLACLDQVVQWLDSMQGTGELPAQAAAQAIAIVERFGRSARESPDPVQERRPPPGNWVSALLAQHEDVRAQAATAIRYVPHADCFFRGEDPLARMAALPGLLCLDLEPSAPWPALDGLDPFACNLVISALTRASAAEAQTAFGDVMDQCDVQALVNETTEDERSPLRLARAIVAEQICVLAEAGVESAGARTASAARVAGNVLRHLGKTGDADRIMHALRSTAGPNAQDLVRASIETALVSMSPAATLVSQGQVRTDAIMRTLRVDATRIDALVNLTGELTVAKNAIGHAVHLAQQEGSPLAPVLKSRHAVLDRLVGELQRSVIGMRVLPLRYVFQRFPRLVREISADLGKPANLVTEGDETEADKVVVEMLFEPLLHLMRNALDHGVEDATVRAANGKPPVATIQLRALRQGEHVVVEVTDDGRGIDVMKVRQAARDRKVAAEEIITAMSDAEAIDLIFAPGFSTATEVSSVSGRGVGMDAVRTAVERLSGRVDIESRTGQGTTVRLTLPFSVLMTRVMTVEAGGQMFGIPLDAVVETVRISTDNIVPIGAGKAIVMRNRTMPLVELASALGITREQAGQADATVVITRTDGHFAALQVDRLDDRMEVMLKPLDGLVSGTPGIAGSTLLGDGSVLLVLDLLELMQ